MAQVFLKHIHVDECRNLKDFDIPISTDSRKHLILTGKNGSGKTSLLNSLVKFLMVLIHDHDQPYGKYGKYGKFRAPQDDLGDCQLEFSSDFGVKLADGTFLITAFDAKRSSEIKVPSGINKVEIPKKPKLRSHENVKFLQYLVNLKADRSFARDDGKNEDADRIDAWFTQFTEQLRNIFDAAELTIEFDRHSYTFNIVIPDMKPFGFNALSDGYSAILSIVTELLLRMEAHGAQRKAYDMEGLVLIDEIETHLHVDLQKKILPFLISVFPNIQFIVSTHSPFVLSSVSNAVVCDLEKRLITEDLSGYSYDALIECYFDSDQYSYEVKAKLKEYEQLVSESPSSYEHQQRLAELETYFDAIPKQHGLELAVRLQQIKLERLNTVK